jgi:hypothetical protein
MERAGDVVSLAVENKSYSPDRMMACYLPFGIHARYPNILPEFFMVCNRHQPLWVLAHVDIWLMAIRNSRVLDESDHQYISRFVHPYF